MAAGVKGSEFVAASEADPSAALRDDKLFGLRDDKGEGSGTRAWWWPGAGWLVLGLELVRGELVAGWVTRSHLLTTMMTERPDSCA